MNFKEIEEKWRKAWEAKPELYKAYDSEEEFEKVKGFKSKGKKYVLVEFPYPSGSGLHVGHTFSYAATDVYARFKRMQGYNVLCPMGWDAFGLPTENFAIKTKRKPQEITKENTDVFKKQMKTLAMGLDWERELFTTDPNYYKWTQWIFIKLWEAGLAHKQKMPINWCPSCKIGLANEEVVDGKCERCGTVVEKREIEQWVIDIWKYADRLLEGLEKTEFQEKIKAAQINWIGKKSGARINFELSVDSNRILQTSQPLREASDLKIDSSSDNSKIIEVFTTRPDTIFGASALVIAPEHKLVNQLTSVSVDQQIDSSTIANVQEYVEKTKKESEMERLDMTREKTGVFTGLYAINPANGKEIPVWVADYVLAGFGTGAIMSVPGHDSRDYEFAKKFGLEIIRVVDKLTSGSVDQEKEEYFEGEGTATNSGFLDGLSTQEAKKAMIKWLEEKKIGGEETTYHLRDWIFSRQHYWGEPMPMYRPEGSIEWKPVGENELPVILPDVENYEPSNDGRSPLANIYEFCQYVNPTIGEKGERETDTMPNWAGSDWYFLGYLMPEVWSSYAKASEDKVSNVNVFEKNQERLKYWLPVDVYIGGDEHTTLHLLYSRFIHQFLYDLGMVPTPEPYFKRLSHGTILGPDGSRMSKSKGNVIDPIPVAQKVGVDVVRSYLMFMGPFEATMPWNENTMMGVKRFLDKFEKFVVERVSSEPENQYSSKEVSSLLNKTIGTISRDLEQFKFNTPLAKMMELLNSVNELTSKSVNQGIVSKNDLGKMVVMLAPFAPYLAEELWEKLAISQDSVHASPWPTVDSSKIASELVFVPVCINGKVRGQLEVGADVAGDQAKLENEAKKLSLVAPYLEGKTIKKVIYVPGKMLNFVI